MRVAVRQHQWVLHMICPIEVLTDGAGDPVPIVDPDKREMAEENAVYGCMACSSPLNRKSVDTECPGSDDGE